MPSNRRIAKLINIATRNFETRETRVLMATMDEKSVLGFIESHRAKLEREKENLGMATIQSR